MKVGKLDTDLLRKIVFRHITFQREEVLVRPGVGEDCAVVDFGDYACVLSTDPITGTASEVGRLAVHISCNDVASNGVEPLGLMLTIMAPEGTTADEIEEIMKQAGREAGKLNVEIIGGHTEITTAVNRMIVSATAIGRQIKSKVVATRGAQVGDLVLMTKTAGLEGTAIIAHEKADQLIAYMGPDMVNSAKIMMDKISVVPEGMIGGAIGTSSMHDITEGGLLGAVWELCEAAGVGIEIYMDKIPIAAETERVCKYFGIDPLRLISSGCMLMTISMDKEKDLLEALKEQGIQGTVIGRVTTGGRFLIDGKEKLEIAPPESDELYKVV
ncbi:hydrogenase expression/formation protein HypE [Anaerosolibacter carboniphilus]|uniref:Hydrogenase expression/formation protein HypE n=1 Tax=Anaerosolibacter carboniphilus TaxID=1417629 RepID=A0A841KL52_9FIRM|nr:AIR synthase family protein [Anaerosolibacter carboniphilus]MBB6213961.1 hydrogenase expression/formation protein HypE [Anaerosolibacter carboniphilus]